MSDAREAMDFESRAERVLSKFDDEGTAVAPDGAAAPEVEPEAPEIPAPQAGEQAPAETPASPEAQGHSEPAPEAPAIEPPKYLKAEYRDRWKELPTDWQRYLSDQEEENSRTVSTKLSEAARVQREAETAQKAANDRAAETAQIQQRYAQQLDAFRQTFEQFDPVLNEYRNTDLVKLARENPARYAELEATVRQRQQVLAVAQHEQQRTQAQALQEHFAREEQRVFDAFPAWRADATLAKRSLDDMRAFAVKEFGFRPEEVQTIADARYVRLVDVAMKAQSYKIELDALKAKQATSAKETQAALAAKRAPPPPTQVVKPGPSSEVASKTAVERNKALLKQARKVGNLSSKAEILAQLMDET